MRRIVPHFIIMDKKDVINAIENCPLHIDCKGTWVCKNEVLPCDIVVENRKCKALIELFAEEKRDLSEM